MQYEPRAKGGFNQQLLNGTRDNVGWIVYTHSSVLNAIIAREAGEKKLKLKDLLDECT